MTAGYVLAAGVVLPQRLGLVPGWLRAVTDAPREEPPADPRDALIREQAERIAALEAMVAGLAGAAGGGGARGVAEQREFFDAAELG